MTIREAARDLPVVGHYDVAVIGGGVAGVAAAVAAERCGRRTILIENQCVLGGLATAGLVAIYLPVCDGRGRQVIAGISEEMLRLTAQHAPARIPDCWRSPSGDPAARRQERYLSRFAPHPYMLALEQFVLAAGVELSYDTRLVGAVLDGDRIDAAIIESKSGRQAVRARVFVDASGDADLCHQGGQPTVTHHDNARAAWFYAADATGMRLVQCHASFTAAKPDNPLFGGDTREDVNRMLQSSRPMILDRAEALRREGGDAELYPGLISTLPQFRVTRRLAADFELDEAHVHQWFDDTVTLAGDWRKPGPVYAVPLRTLVAAARSNLLAAGRCTSSTRAGAEVTRAIPVCAATGQAAGTAAALAAADGADVRTLDVSQLQGRLQRDGMLFDRDLVAPADA